MNNILQDLQVEAYDLLGASPDHDRPETFADQTRLARLVPLHLVKAIQYLMWPG